MSNEQLDKLTEVCSVCGTRHLDYHRSKFTHIWQDGEYHPIPYGGKRDTTSVLHL